MPKNQNLGHNGNGSVARPSKVTRAAARAAKFPNGRPAAVLTKAASAGIAKVAGK